MEAAALVAADRWAAEASAVAMAEADPWVATMAAERPWRGQRRQDLLFNHVLPRVEPFTDRTVDK